MQAPLSGCSPCFYGADTTKMNNAVANIWPQLQGPYCGIASAMAMTNYADEDAGQGLRFTSQSQQNNVVSDNHSSGAASQWGWALAGGNNVAGESNISLDFGIDPRSLAYMSWNYTPFGYYYHNIIYRPSMVSPPSNDHSTQVLQGISRIGFWLEDWGDPVIVAINQGTHFVLVSGVYSYNDPMTWFPAQIFERNLPRSSRRDTPPALNQSMDMGDLGRVQLLGAVLRQSE